MECRTTEEIQKAFDELQDELRPDISEKMKSVRQSLLENFDEAVRDKLKIDYEKTKEYLNTFEQKLWNATQYYLRNFASFSQQGFSFKLTKNPFPSENIHPGPYMILSPSAGKKKSDIEIPDDTNVYRIGHKLAEKILFECKKAETPAIELEFDYTNTQTKITLLEQKLGQTGWLQIQHLIINSFELEDYLLIACFTENNEIIDSETAAKLFSLSAIEKIPVLLPDNVKLTFQEILFRERHEVIEENSMRNRDFFDVEMDKLDQWAGDMKISLEKEIKDLDAEIKLRKAEAKKLLNLEAKVKAQRQIKDLEKKRSEKRQFLFSAQDDIDDKKENLLSDIEKRLNQKVEQKEIFTIKWTIV